MGASTIIMRGLAWIIIVMLVIPPGMPAQDEAQPEETDKFSKEELTQMLAPLALYPDSLAAQVLMASTYPLEVVEAERWLRENEGLEGDALDDALLEKTWDPSVKALCHFPDVLFAMSDKLDQTRKLGDAFISQEEEVMSTIQELRRKAGEQGNLRTTNEQKVIVEKEVIRIEPADPQVVYVPVYDPYYVYGPWWYPAYPPYYWYYPPGYVAGGYIGFRHRVFIGYSWFPWVWFDWHYHRVHVDIHKTRRFHRHDHRHDYDRREWRHNPYHRKGVAYRSRTVSQRFGSRRPPAFRSDPERRGYPPGRIERRDSRPPQRPERREGPGTPRVRTERERVQSPAVRDNPFRRIDEGKFERKASKRGSSSRKSADVIRKGKSSPPQDRGGTRKGGPADRPVREGPKGGGRGFRR